MRSTQKDFAVNEERFTLESNCEVLGTGTFGETLKVQDLETRDYVVVHQIKVGKDSTKTHGYDEFQKLCNCGHTLLVPIIGYTESAVSLFVTEYITDGSLEQILKKYTKYEWFDDTQRTIIALGILKAMQFLHDSGLIHGNLKPSNVFIGRLENGKFLPQLAEYGLMKFARNRQDNEYDSGDDVITEASDVYSYGAILNSLLEHRKGPTTGTSNIRGIISLCMKEDPDDRPSFKDLFDHNKKDIMFPLADAEEVGKIMNELDKEERRRSRAKFKVLGTLDEDFEERLLTLSEDVTEKDAAGFFHVISKHFSAETERDFFVPILSVCRKLTEKSAFANAFVETRLNEKLPMSRSNLVKYTLPIVANLVNHCPNSIDENMANTLALMLSDDEQKVLHIVAEYAKKFAEIYNPWPLLDIILKQWKKITYNMPAYVSIYYFLCDCFDDYKENRLQACTNIMVSICKTRQTVATIRGAMAFIIHFYQGAQMPIKTKYLTKMLEKRELANSAVSCLLASGVIEPSEEMVQSVLSLATVSRKAGMLLCKLADTGDGSALLMNELGFLENDLPRCRTTFQIFLILYKDDRNREALMNSESVAILLTNMVKGKIYDIIDTLNFLTVSPVNARMAEMLEAYGLLELVNHDEFKQNDTYMALLFSVIARMAEATNLASFPELLELVVKDMKKQKRLMRPALYFISGLSKYKEYAPRIRQINVKLAFASLSAKNRRYLRIVEGIKENVNAFKYAEPEDSESTASYLSE